MSNILEAIQELNEDKTDLLIDELLKKYPGSELRGGRFFCVNLKTLVPTTQWEGVIAFLIKKNEKKVSLPTQQNYFTRASAGYVDQKTLDQIFGFKKALDDNKISSAVRTQESATIDRDIKEELRKKFSKNNIPQDIFYPVSVPSIFHIYKYCEKIGNKQLDIWALNFGRNLSEIEISLAQIDDIKKDVKSISSIIDNIKFFVEHDFKGEIVTTIFNLLANECDLEGHVKTVTEIIHIDANDVPKFDKSKLRDTMDIKRENELTEYLLDTYSEELRNNNLLAIFEAELAKDRYTLAENLGFYYCYFLKNFNVNIFKYQNGQIWDFIREEVLVSFKGRLHFSLMHCLPITEIPEELLSNPDVKIFLRADALYKIPDGVKEIKCMLWTNADANVLLPKSFTQEITYTCEFLPGVREAICNLVFTPVKDSDGNLVSPFTIYKALFDTLKTKDHIFVI